MACSQTLFFTGDGQSPAALLTSHLSPITSHFSPFAGDIVPKKKPAPDIYLFASRELGVPPDHCIAVEDSRNGLLAAAAAGIRTVVTTSYFTADENFDEAVLVLDSLGDPEGKTCTILANRTGHQIGKYLKASDLEAIFGGVAFVLVVGRKSRRAQGLTTSQTFHPRRI